MILAEKLLVCTDCKKNFIFTVKEQEYHFSRGFPNEPGRCPRCQQARKTNIPQNENSARSYLRSSSYFR
jgi:hypothetical protein